MCQFWDRSLRWSGWFSTDRAGGVYDVDPIKVSSIVWFIKTRAMGFVLNETVNKLTPDGPLRGLLWIILSLFSSFVSFERLFKDFFFMW